MIQSDTIEKLAPALVAAQGEFESVAKTADNPFFKSMYADLPSVVRAASPILFKHGLAVTQTLGDDTLTTVLLHVSGQYIGDTSTLHLSKQDAQGVGSAVTYHRRYSYMSILGLVADVDDDGNAASQTSQTPVSRPAPQTPAPQSQTAGAQRPYVAPPEGTVYLTVPFQEKDEVKGLGARWDGQAQQPDSNKKGRWYIPEGADPFPLLKWVEGGLPEQQYAQDEEPF